MHYVPSSTLSATVSGGRFSPITEVLLEENCSVRHVSAKYKHHGLKVVIL